MNRAYSLSSIHQILHRFVARQSEKSMQLSMCVIDFYSCYMHCKMNCLSATLKVVYCVHIERLSIVDCQCVIFFSRFVIVLFWLFTNLPVFFSFFFFASFLFIYLTISRSLWHSVATVANNNTYAINPIFNYITHRLQLQSILLKCRQTNAERNEKITKQRTNEKKN